MGDIADMMLEGVLCEGCGGLLGEGHGFPGLCHDCAKEGRAAGQEIRDTGLGYFQNVTPVNLPQHEKTPCKQCGKRVKRVGMSQHVNDVHQDKPNE